MQMRQVETGSGEGKRNGSDGGGGWVRTARGNEGRRRG